MTAALIIAAGRTDSKDNFSPEKKIGTITAIERIVLQLQTTGIRCIVVICDEDEKPKKLVPSMNLIFLTAPEGGDMLDSIKTGLTYLQGKCSEALVSYVDVPMFSGNTLRSLMAAEGEVNIPCYHGKCGHPVLLRESCFRNIIDYNEVKGSAGKGLKAALIDAGVKKCIVDVDDAGILTEQQTDVYYRDLVSDSDIMKIRMSFKIRLSREKVFYGTGVHQLLGLTEELGSLSGACQYMGISYSKGRKIIHIMEEQLGSPVLETRQGGKDGGYSHLTDVAKRLMKAYSGFISEAEEALQPLFEKYFDSFINDKND